MSPLSTDATESRYPPGALWPTGEDMDRTRRRPSLTSRDGSVVMTQGPDGIDLSAGTSYGLSVGRNATLGQWDITATTWTLPMWLQWHTGGDELTIPYGAVDGTIWCQLTDSPSARTGGAGDCRLLCNIAGATPNVTLTHTWGSGPRPGAPLSPLLYICLGRFVGAADGTFLLTKPSAICDRAEMFNAWALWFTVPYTVRHGRDALYIAVSSDGLNNLYVPYDPDNAPNTHTLSINANDHIAGGPGGGTGRSNWHYLYSTFNWTASNTAESALLQMTWDGTQTILDLAFCSVTAVQTYTP